MVAAGHKSAKHLHYLLLGGERWWRYSWGGRYSGCIVQGGAAAGWVQDCYLVHSLQSEYNALEYTLNSHFYSSLLLFVTVQVGICHLGQFSKIFTFWSYQYFTSLEILHAMLATFISPEEGCSFRWLGFFSDIFFLRFFWIFSPDFLGFLGGFFQIFFGFFPNFFQSFFVFFWILLYLFFIFNGYFYGIF